MLKNSFWTYWKSFKQNYSGQQKGQHFEKIACYYLRYFTANRQEYEQVVFANEPNTSIDDRIHQLWGPNINYRDRGIDIVVKRKDGSYDLVQCKAWESQKTINGRDLSSFFHAVNDLRHKGLKINNLIIFNLSQTGGLSIEHDLIYRQIKKHYPIQNITASQLNQIDFVRFEQDQKPVYNAPFAIREYQAIAVKKTMIHFATHDKGKLIMASGTGKTFTAWQIIQHFISRSRSACSLIVIFLCPSLNLLNQTAQNFINWRYGGARRQSFNFVGVCSWPKLGDDTAHYVPTFRDGAKLKDTITNYQRRHDRSITILFCTYQSIQIVIDAQVQHQLPPFDLAILDEAHHTVGIWENNTLANERIFSSQKKGFYRKVHDDGLDSTRHLRARKRLFMTATPKIFKDVQRSNRPPTLETIAMDDERYYGSTIFDYSYKLAVEGKWNQNNEPVLSDYCIIIAVYKTTVPIVPHKRWKPTDETKCLVIAKQLFKLSNDQHFASDPHPMRRTLFYTNSVWYSKMMAGNNLKHPEAGFDQIVSNNQAGFKHDWVKMKKYQIHIKHMDGSTSQLERINILEDFAKCPNQTVQIISNVGVLGEGVDIPTLDAVVFVHPRKNKINIAQIAGRVFRKPPTTAKFSKKRGYIILPLVINRSQQTLDNTWEIDNSEFSEIKNVITKMREIDQSLTSETLWRRIKIRTYSHNPLSNSIEEWDSNFSGEDPLIAQIRPQILGLMTKIDQANFKSQLASTAHRIKRAVTRLDAKLLASQPKLQTEWRQLKKVLTKNLNQSYQNDQQVRGFLTQHLIMTNTLQSVSGHGWNQSVKIHKIIDRFLNVWYECDANLPPLFNSSGTTNWSHHVTTSFVKEVFEYVFERIFSAERKRYGIYYTPVHVVDFMLKSVENILQHEFNSSFNAKNNIVLDPFAGTGSFLARLCSEELNLISRNNLEHKLKKELYSIELQPLAYYGCRINVESVVNQRLSEQTSEYLTADHCLLGDTFMMYEKQRKFLATRNDTHNWNGGGG